MQKNKFIHEDIKAVCSSATKKLIACGLVVAVNGGNIVNAQTRKFDAKKQLKKELQVEESTAVGSVSNTANSQSRSSRQPRATAGSSENGTSQTTEKTKWRKLSPEELKAVIAKGKGEYQTWLDWCKANRVCPVTEFLALDAGEELGEAALDFSFSENGGRFIVTPQAQDQPANNSPIVASELTTEVNAANNSGERVTSNYSAEDFAKDAEELVALMRARTNEIEEAFEDAKNEFEKQKKEVEELERDIDELTIKRSKKSATILAYYEHNPSKGSWAFTHDNYLNIDDESVQRFGNLPEKVRVAAHHAYALRHKLDYLRERIRDYNRRLEGGSLSWLMYSQRYHQVESSLQAQSPEPDRYDIGQAPEYVEWATNEVNRLEPLARDMLQQLLNDLHTDVQEQIDFENRMWWFNPQCEVTMLRTMAETDSLDEFLDAARQVTETLQNLHRAMEENIAFFSQPYTPPTLTSNDDVTAEDKITEKLDSQQENNNQENSSFSQEPTNNNEDDDEIKEKPNWKEEENQRKKNKHSPVPTLGQQLENVIVDIDDAEFTINRDEFEAATSSIGNMPQQQNPGPVILPLSGMYQPQNQTQQQGNGIIRLVGNVAGNTVSFVKDIASGVFSYINPFSGKK